MNGKSSVPRLARKGGNHRVANSTSLALDALAPTGASRTRTGERRGGHHSSGMIGSPPKMARNAQSRAPTSVRDLVAADMS
eukprot:2573750-Prymnesium_polylepis.1